jgi:hypothetical protein
MTIPRERRNGSIMGSEARQQLVREVNERIRELSLNGAEALKAGQTRFLCECSDPACLETMELSFVEYERVRNQHGQILVAARHEVEAPSADNLDAVLEEIRTEAADIRSELRLRLAETRQTSERDWPERGP